MLSFANTLPASRNPPSPPPWQAAADGETGTRSTALRVLAVDDNEDAVVMLAKLLGVFGHETRYSTSGAEALLAGAAFEPDVVVLDLGMPGLDGLETARRLRKERWGEGVMLIALTGWGQPEDLQRTRAAGFDAHLVKPLEIDKLLDLLKNRDPL